MVSNYDVDFQQSVDRKCNKGYRDGLGTLCVSYYNVYEAQSLKNHYKVNNLMLHYRKQSSVLVNVQ